MRTSFLHAVLLLLAVSFCGCGASEPGSTVEDDRPAGEATTPISDDPDEVTNMMGDDYEKQNR